MTAFPVKPRFRRGEAGRVHGPPAVGHCRTPWYLRGKAGVIAAVQGVFRDPERLAYHKPGLPAQVLYTVRFRQGDLWDRYPGLASDRLDADLYEHWLEPTARQKRG